MRRFWAIFLTTLLAVSSFPLAAQARFVCRVSGEAMMPVAMENEPRSCCDLRVTPGHAPLPGATTPEPAASIAVLPTMPFVAPVPAFAEAGRSVAFPGVPRYRGPPPSSTSPRGPPVFS